MKPALLLFAALFPVLAPAASVELSETPEHGLQPRMLVDPHGTLHVLWYAGDSRGGDVFHAVRNPDKSWGTPVRVNSEPGSAIAAGTIRGAQAVLGRDGHIHVVWNGSGAKLPKGSQVPMFYSRSTDNGRTFEPQRAISGDWPLDGGGAVAADAQGHVHVFWHAGKVMRKGGEMDRRVFLRTSDDDGKNFLAEHAISPAGLGVCGCCAMQALATKDGGSIYALFRSAFDGGMSRHIVSLVSHDGGRSFAHAIVDKWNIAACPMSSMSLLETRRGIAGAWEREGQVFLGLFENGSTTPTQLISPQGEAGQRKHPVLAVNEKGELLLAWTVGTGWQKGGGLAWQLFDGSFQPMMVRGTTTGVSVWSFGGAAAVADKFVVLK